MCGLRDRSDLAHSRPFPTVRTVRTVHTVRHRPAPSGTVRHNSQWVPSGPQWSPVSPVLGLIRISRHLKMIFALKKLIKCRDMSRHLPENFDI
jgi:hypothetical protein